MKTVSVTIKSGGRGDKAERSFSYEFQYPSNHDEMLSSQMFTKDEIYDLAFDAYKVRRAAPFRVLLEKGEMAIRDIMEAAKLWTHRAGRTKVVTITVDQGLDLLANRAMDSEDPEAMLEALKARIEARKQAKVTEDAEVEAKALAE